MQIKSYEEAIEYLESFIGKIRFEITPEFIKKHDPLERMRVLLSLLGNPQNKFRSVLVGGTSGKSSTAYLISHILTTAGYKTGLTLSPHLQRVNERIQTNNQPVSDEEFAELVSSIVQTIELMKKMKVGAPSYFEILIAMAFLYFVQNKVDLAVVEVGMGGEFDATNTLYPLIAVITNVSLDHTGVLGNTVEKIARTKAGIIKSIKYKVLSSKYLTKNLVVVSGVKQQSVFKMVEEKCKRTGAKLFRLGRDFSFELKKEAIGGTVFDFRNNLTTRLQTPSIGGQVKQFNNIGLSLLGEYQVENACLAIETVRQLADFGFKVSEQDIRKALKAAFFPGRFEYVIHNTKYKILLDGAHNPTKMKAFLTTLEKLYPKNPKIFIIAFKKDKNIIGMLREIVKVADNIIVTRFHAKTDMDLNASADADKIEENIKILRYYDTKKIMVEKEPRKAINVALNISVSEFSNNPTIIVVTGSLYLVGEIRNML